MTLALSTNTSNWASNAELARNELDVRMTSLEGESMAHIQEMKNRRNEWASTSRLPLEILCRIFLHYKKLHHAHDMGWIGISHVCQRWRNACLDYVPLWTDVSHERTRWVKPMLERSKSALISISWTNEREGYEYDDEYWYGGLEELFSEAISQTWRLISLDLRASSNAISPLLVFLSSPMPVLEKLFLDVYEGELDLQNLLPDGVPQLKQLLLACCSFPWTSPLFAQGLTTLAIFDPGMRPHPTPEVFLSTLSNMQQLTELRLESAIPDFHPSSASHPLAFPNLIYFEVNDELQRCNDFLQRLSIPTSTKITLHIWDTSESAITEFSSIFPSIWGQFPSNSKFQHSSAPKYQSLSLSPCNSYSIQVSGWCQYLEFTGDRHNPGDDLACLRFTAWDGPLFNALPAFALDSVKALHLREAFPSQDEANLRLAQLPSVDRIRVDSPEAFMQLSEFIATDPAMLQGPPPDWDAGNSARQVPPPDWDAGNSATPPLRFLHLKTLLLYNVDIKERSSIEYPTNGQSSQWRAKLHDFVTLREKRGYKLDKVVVAAWLSQMEVAQLKQLVSEVTVLSAD